MISNLFFIGFIPHHVHYQGHIIKFILINILFLIINFLIIKPIYSLPCTFNSLCSCTASESGLKSIACINSQLITLPKIPYQHVYRYTIIGSNDLRTLESNIFQNTLVSAFTVKKCSLTVIDDNAFNGSQKTLTSLDLSYNNLNEFPINALINLPLLQWLSLKNNAIQTLNIFTSNIRDKRYIKYKNNKKFSLNGHKQLARHAGLSMIYNNSNSNSNNDNNYNYNFYYYNYNNKIFNYSSFSDSTFSTSFLYNNCNYKNDTLINNNKKYKRSFNSYNQDNEHKDNNDYNDNDDKDDSDKGSYYNALSGLRSLILSDNQLHRIDDKAFKSLENLEFLDMDNNIITRIDGHPFPLSLTSLSIGHNLLEKIPTEAIWGLTKLKWITLRGNLIKHLPHYWPFSLDKIEILDLGNNLIVSLTNLFFTIHLTRHNYRQNSNYHRHYHHLHYKHQQHQYSHQNENQNNSQYGYHQNQQSNHNSQSQSNNEQNLLYHKKPDKNDDTIDSHIYIRDLHLDYNLIETIKDDDFMNISIERLSLSNNRINKISSACFNGSIGKSLKVIDLSYNLLVEYPQALRSLSSLVNLLLRGNNLSILEDNVFSSLSTLQVLDLSSNQFTRIPSALNRLSTLLKLNLQDNQIKFISSYNFNNWSSSLIYLSLAKNGLISIEENAFINCKNLRELKLSDNNLINLKFLKPLNKLSILELSSSIHQKTLTNIKSSSSILSSILPKSSKSLRKSLIASAYSSLSSSKSIPSKSLSSSMEEEVELYSPNEFSLSYTLNSDYKQSNELSFDNLPSLVHLDMESNSLESIIINNTIHKKLRNILLSGNNIAMLPSKIFKNLNIVNIILLYNHIELISPEAFVNLSSLHTIVLSSNRLRTIAAKAIYNCSKLMNLLIQDNQLDHLSLDILNNVNNDIFINASNNNIKYLKGPYNNVKSLDLSYNQLSSFPYGFHKLTSLILSHNNLTVMPFKQLANSINLTILNLDYNNIHLWDYEEEKKKEAYETIKDKEKEIISDNNNDNIIKTQQQTTTNQTNLEDKRLLTSISSSSLMNIRSQKKPICCPKLQSLSISGNYLTNLAGSPFKSFPQLTTVDLSYNSLESLSFNLIPSLVKLNISHNLLNTASFYSCLNGSLKILDLSFNYLKSVPDALNNCSKLTVLDLSHNFISELREGLFSNLNNLQILRLAYNHLKKVASKSFLLENLRILNLEYTGLHHIPSLPLIHLTHLNLSGNKIDNITIYSLNKIKSLRSLDISNNKLVDVPKHVWKYINSLTELNIAYNPIDILNANSLRELISLKQLDITGLGLKYIDLRSLSMLRHLLSIKTSTYPRVRSFRLNDLLSKCISLQSASILIREPILSHQIQWSFGPKLKELTITGPRLSKILPDAFLGLYHGPDLTIRIIETNITELPIGLLRYINDVRLINIDLRNNRLIELKKEVIYYNGRTRKNSPFYITGSIDVESNPLICTCDLIWLRNWLIKWIRETRKMQFLNPETSIQSFNKAKNIKCILYDQMKVSIIHLNQYLKCNSVSIVYNTFEQMILIMLTITYIQLID